MKKSTVGQADKLRALTDDPELRALVEKYYAVKPSEREPYGAFLEVFIAKTDALYPHWRETLEAAGSDGRIVRALAIHCVLRIRARSDLDELERFEAKTAETDFVSSFDEVTESPSASAAFRMTLAFHELMRIAKLIQTKWPRSRGRREKTSRPTPDRRQRRKRTGCNRF